MGFLNLLRVQWDRAAAVVLAVGGLIAILVGWNGASNTPHVAVQIPYFISGGLLGIFLIGIAAVLWLSADMRDEWRELRRIRVLLESEQRDALPAVDSAGVEAEPDTADVLAPPRARRRTTTTTRAPRAAVAGSTGAQRRTS